MHGFRGAGRLRFALYDESTGLLINKWYPFGNTQSLALTHEAETIDVVSTDHEGYGEVLDTMDEPKPATGKLSANTFNHRTLAIAFMGESAVKSISETTITDEDVVAVVGGSVRLAEGLASALTVQDETDTTTYVDGDDYTMETGPGFTILSFPEGSSIADEDALHVDYTSGADVGILIHGGTKISRKIALMLDGRNLMTKEKGLLDIYQCTIKPSGGFDHMSKDPATQEYEIMPVKLPGKPAVYSFHASS